jgi:hypothetical protein
VGVGTVIGALLLGAMLLWHFVGRPAQTEAPAAPGAEPGIVEMQLRGVPADARVRLDGRPVEGAVLRGVTSAPAVLEVEARGYVPLRIELRFEAGAVIDLGGRLRTAPAGGG